VINYENLGDPDLPFNGLDGEGFMEYPEPNEALINLLRGTRENIVTDIPEVYDSRKLQTEIRDLAVDFCLSAKTVDTVERFITKIIELSSYYRKEEK
jgi:hypothetical protein